MVSVAGAHALITRCDSFRTEGWLASHQCSQTRDMGAMQVDAVKNFWTQFGVNVVDHHLHEEGASVHMLLLPAVICTRPRSLAFA